MPLATAPRRPPTPGARPSPAPPPSPGRADRAFFLDVPFHHRGFAEDFGSVWDEAAKHFVFYGDELPGALSPYRGEKYSWERLREDARNAEHGFETDDPPGLPPEREIKLRPHQLEGGRAVYRAWNSDRFGFLVADDVGLGKTFQTWKAVMHMDEVDTVLVVCPLAVVAHWRRSIRWMGDAGKRVVVINYDRLKKLFDVPAKLPAARKGRGKGKARKVRTQKGVARFGSAFGFDVVIWDESHKLRARDSARSKLAAKIDAGADFRVWLSATAGQDPLELEYLAALLAEGSGSSPADIGDYHAWCKARGIGLLRGDFGKWTWRGNSDDPAEAAKGDEDLALIREILFGGKVPAGIRRSPTDIAGWPEINRILLPVALEGEDRFLYEQAWGEFRDALDLEAKGRPDPRNALVIRLRFRQKASLLRTAHTVDHVRELLGQGQSVAVSVAFHDTSDVIRAALEGGGQAVRTIDGRNTARQNEANRLDFQHGRARVCVHTVEEGISLHQGEYPGGGAARSNVIHDLRWSAIQMKQIEGRTHRDGKFSQVYWMIADRTVEERLALVVGRRIRSMGLMQDEAGTSREIETLLAGLRANA